MSVYKRVRVFAPQFRVGSRLERFQKASAVPESPCSAKYSRDRRAHSSVTSGMLPACPFGRWSFDAFIENHDDLRQRDLDLKALLG